MSYTVKYILIECSNFAEIRKCIYKTNNMRDMFKNMIINYILSFLKEIRLYQKYNSKLQFYSTNLPLKVTPNLLSNK